MLAGCCVIGPSATQFSVFLIEDTPGRIIVGTPVQGGIIEIDAIRAAGAYGDGGIVTPAVLHEEVAAIHHDGSLGGFKYFSGSFERLGGSFRPGVIDAPHVPGNRHKVGYRDVGDGLHSLKGTRALVQLDPVRQTGIEGGHIGPPLLRKSRIGIGRRLRFLRSRRFRPRPLGNGRFLGGTPAPEQRGGQKDQQTFHRLIQSAE